MEGMISYTEAGMERAKKREAILRAIVRKITWWQEAEIIGISDRLIGRWRQRYGEFRVRGLETAIPERVSGVRIPLPPPHSLNCRETLLRCS